MNHLLEFVNNHTLLATGTLLMALAVLFYEIRLRGQNLFNISTAQAVALINKGARVVDLRPREAYQAGHIVDALSIPLEELASAQDNRLKKNRPLIFVCENGTESARSVASLRKQGFDNVFSLAGGLAAWRQDNLPVVTK